MGRRSRWRHRHRTPKWFLQHPSCGIRSRMFCSIGSRYSPLRVISSGSTRAPIRQRPCRPTPRFSQAPTIAGPSSPNSPTESTSVRLCSASRSQRPEPPARNQRDQNQSHQHPNHGRATPAGRPLQGYSREWITDQREGSPYRWRGAVPPRLQFRALQRVGRGKTVCEASVEWFDQGVSRAILDRPERGENRPGARLEQRGGQPLDAFPSYDPSPRSAASGKDHDIRGQSQVCEIRRSDEAILVLSGRQGQRGPAERAFIDDGMGREMNDAEAVERSLLEERLTRLVPKPENRAPAIAADGSGLIGRTTKPGQPAGRGERRTIDAGLLISIRLRSESRIRDG